MAKTRAHGSGEFEVVEFTYRSPPADAAVGHPVRVVMIDQEPWFLAVDVCWFLGCTIRPALLSINETDRLLIHRPSLQAGKTALPEQRHEQPLWFVTDRAVYELVLRLGNGDESREFRRWLMHEVLPTIRHSDLPWTPRNNLPLVRRRVRVAKEVTGEGQARLRGRRHALYRLYDEHGQLLYVGISWKPLVRMSEHQSAQPWWHKVSEIRLEWHPGRAEALAAEARAIRAESPHYNLVA